MLKRSDKVYYQNDWWIVFLNNRNTIKVGCKKENKVYDYFKDIYFKDTDVPKYISKKCSEIHSMWQNGSIWSWIEEKEKEKAMERKKLKEGKI